MATDSKDAAPDIPSPALQPGQVRDGYKICSKCREVKLAAPSFWKDPTKKGGYTSWCKQCFSKSSQRRKEQGPEVRVTERECSICKLRKPASAFMKDSRRITGLDARCRECRRAQHAARKQRNIESGNTVWEEKECKRCHTVKPAAMFKRHAYTISGLDSWCKQCCSERRKELLAQKALQHIGDPAAEDNVECSTCLRFKPISEFASTNQQSDSRQRRCKACTKDLVKTARLPIDGASDVEHSEEDLEASARRTVQPTSVPQPMVPNAGHTASPTPPNALFATITHDLLQVLAASSNTELTPVGADNTHLLLPPGAAFSPGGAPSDGAVQQLGSQTHVTYVPMNSTEANGRMGGWVANTNNTVDGLTFASNDLTCELPSFSACFNNPWTNTLITPHSHTTANQLPSENSNVNANNTGNELGATVALQQPPRELPTGTVAMAPLSRNVSMQPSRSSAFKPRTQSAFSTGVDRELLEELFGEDTIPGLQPRNMNDESLLNTARYASSLIGLPGGAILDAILNGQPSNTSLTVPVAVAAVQPAAAGDRSTVVGVSRAMSIRMESAAASERATSLRGVVDASRSENVYGLQPTIPGRIESLIGDAMRIDSLCRWDSLLRGAAQDYAAASFVAPAQQQCSLVAADAAAAAAAAAAASAASHTVSSKTPAFVVYPPPTTTLGPPQPSLGLSAFDSLPGNVGFDGTCYRTVSGGADLGTISIPSRMVSLVSADGMDFAIAFKSRQASDVSLVDAVTWQGGPPTATIATAAAPSSSAQAS